MSNASQLTDIIGDNQSDSRQARKPYFTLPASFEAEECLPNGLRRQRHNANWLVSTLLTKRSRRPLQPSVRLYSPFLHRMMGHHYRDVLDALIAGEAIVRIGSYTVGKQSFAYTLHERFKYDSHVRTPIENKPMLKRLDSLYENGRAQLEGRLLPVHGELWNRQLSLCIDGDQARKRLLQTPESNPFDCQGVLVRDIEEASFRLSVGRFGRVANNITSLKRGIRSTLHVDGCSLACADLTCAQPALLGMLMLGVCGKLKLPKTENIVWFPPCALSLASSLPGACARYLDCVLDGLLYERLRESSPSMSRAEIKHRILCDVLAKKADYPSPVEDAFKRMFPEVHRFIRACNRDHHATLIRLLQRLESWLVIETVCARIVKRQPELFVISLHDAVYAKANELSQVVAAFDEVFDEIGFRMHLKVEL